MRSRALRLNTERLAPLAPADLASVAGGTIAPHCVWAHTAGPDCWNDITFEWCPIVTLPIEDCI